MDNRPKIEIVRVSSIERASFRPVDGVQLRAAYSHVRIGTFCPQPEIEVTPICENKPPCQGRKFKKNMGPVSRLLRRRQQGTCLTTKSCDNIYSVNRNSASLDWRLSQCTTEPALNIPRQSSSLDWRVGRRVNSEWQTSCSAEQLNSKSPNLNVSGFKTPTTRSKIVSLLRRLSPRLPRPTSKNSFPSSPSGCPWIRVEYSTESIDNHQPHDNSQEADLSFQHELQLNELRKRIASPSPSSCSQVPINTTNSRGDVNHNVQESTAKADEHTTSQRSVHEDSQHRKAEVAESPAPAVPARNRRPKSGTEVATIDEDNGNNHQDNTTTVTPGGLAGGGSGPRSNRRNRPLSLAVQPLNYQRLDPDTIKHPNMTSQESIGSCSLDVDRSASDRSEAAVDSISERTLHSLNLSNGEAPISPADAVLNGSSETLSKNPPKSPEPDNLNGEYEQADQLTAKKPSYLGLACSISGYSGITRYDSKLREGFRSRDSSPGSRLITRETSPAGFRSSENLGIPQKSQSISPLAMDHSSNGFSNGKQQQRYRDTRPETSPHNADDDEEDVSEVDRGISINTFSQISPIRGSPVKRPYTSNLSVSSPKPSNHLNGSPKATETVSTTTEKSFIQQRVERLYGPGALAQGFFRRSLNSSRDSSFNKSSNNDSIVENANTEESLKNLPVLRHLKPEFRAQLPVVSPRRPTNGTEQQLLRRHLDRLTDISRKTIEEDIEKKLKLMTVVPSIPDQQPAAPDVVLPVLESSSSTSSVPGAIESESRKAVVKDGHYFIKLLKSETDRLFLLADGAEAELASGQQLPEEAAGLLRSAAGKARLLARQKMQQFEGLCQKNINQIPGEEFPTTNEDLAGFWDMVMLQVVQVNDLFDHIDKLKRAEWKEIPVVKSTPPASQNGTNNTKRRAVGTSKAKTTARPEESKKAREAREAREAARRQMMEERRKAMKSTQVQQSVEIFAPKT